MSGLAPFIVVGITTGSIYALASLGLVVTYKTSGVFNFGHGAQAAAGAFVMFELWQRMAWPWPVAAAVALLVAGVGGGLVLERIGFALSSASVAARVAGTVGLLVGISQILDNIFGSTPLNTRYFFPTRTVEVFGVNVSIHQMLVTGFVLVAAVGLSLFMSRHPTGIAMHGVVEDPNLLSLMGTDPAKVRRRAWMVGSTFAAASGILLAPTSGLSAGILTLLVFYAFGAAAVGGFSSLPLTYAGGLAIGLTEAILKKYIDSSSILASLPSTLPILVLFAALLLLPVGRLVERGAAVVRRPLRPLTLPPRLRRSLTAASVVLLIAIPHIATERLSTYTDALAFVILFASLNLLVRTSGQVSLCHMTFAAVGAAAFGHAIESGVPWALAVTAAGLAAALIGAIAAIPAIRLSGVYLAIGTFGFALLFQNLIFPTSLMFGRYGRVLPAPRPDLGFVDLSSDSGYYYVVLAITLAGCGLIVAIRRARLGRLLQGLAEEPIAVDAHGTNTNGTRLWVFCISAGLAGIAGAVGTPVTGSITGVPYAYTISLLLVAVLFVSGRQPILGPFIAAGAYVVLRSYLTSDTAVASLPIVFGIGAVIAAMAGGIPIVDRLRSSKRATERQERRPMREPVAVVR